MGRAAQHSEVLAGQAVQHYHTVMAAASFLTSYSAPRTITITSEVSKCMISILDFMSRRRHCKYVTIIEYSQPFRGSAHSATLRAWF